MAFRIRYSPTALADWKQLAAWSWEHHPESTRRFLLSIWNYIKLLRSLRTWECALSDGLSFGVYQLLLTLSSIALTNRQNWWKSSASATPNVATPELGAFADTALN